MIRGILQFMRCACKLHFHPVEATASQEQDEDMSHVLWSIAEGSWLIHPEYALEKKPVTSYQECDLGSLIGKFCIVTTCIMFWNCALSGLSLLHSIKNASAAQFTGVALFPSSRLCKKRNSDECNYTTHQSDIFHI